MMTQQEYDLCEKYIKNNWHNVCLDECVGHNLHTHNPKKIEEKKCFDCNSDMKFLYQEIRPCGTQIVSGFECSIQCSGILNCFWEIPLELVNPGDVHAT